MIAFASSWTAGSSSRANVCCFIGTTLLFDMTNAHLTPSRILLLTWATACCCHKIREAELHYIIGTLEALYV